MTAVLYLVCLTAGELPTLTAVLYLVCLTAGGLSTLTAELLTLPDDVDQWRQRTRQGYQQVGHRANLFCKRVDNINIQNYDFLYITYKHLY